MPPGRHGGHEQGDGGPFTAESPATASDAALRPWPVRSQRHAARNVVDGGGEGMLGGQPVFGEQHPHPTGPA